MRSEPYFDIVPFSTVTTTHIYSNKYTFRIRNTIYADTDDQMFYFVECRPINSDEWTEISAVRTFEDAVQAASDYVEAH